MSDASPADAPRKRRRWRLWLALFSPLWLPLLFYGCIRIAHPNAGPKNIRVSQETTYFTKPLDDHGNIDYVAAVNAHTSAGVTQENNAAVLFWQSGAIEHIGDARLQAAVSAELGIEPSATFEPAYTSLYSFVDQRPELVPQHAAASNEFAEASLNETLVAMDAEVFPHLHAEDWPAVHHVFLRHRGSLLYEHDDPTWPAHQFGQRYPWTAEVYPEAAAWLAHIEPVMEKLTGMTKRPRYHSPLNGDDNPPHLPAALLPDINSMLEVSRAFSLRAMLRMGEGDVAGAWEDVLAIHRLARLAAQHPTFVGLLTGYVIEGKAVWLEEPILASRQIPREQLEGMLADYRALPPFPSPAVALNRCERCMFLECAIAMANRGGAANVLSRTSFWDAVDPRPKFGLDWWINQIADWNNVLMQGNDFFDRVTVALEEPDFGRRRQLCANIQAELKQLANADGPGRTALSYVRGPVMEERLAAAYLSTLMPDFTAIMLADQRNRVRQDLVETALLLALYRADHGEFPHALSALVPEYCDFVPVDGFAAQPLRYLRHDFGYVLYSVDADGVDNGGLRPGTRQSVHGGTSEHDTIFAAPPLIEPQ